MFGALFILDPPPPPSEKLDPPQIGASVCVVDNRWVVSGQNKHAFFLYVWNWVGNDVSCYLITEQFTTPPPPLPSIPYFL